MTLSRKLYGLLRSRVVVLLVIGILFLYVFLARALPDPQSQFYRHKSTKVNKINISEEREKFSNPIYDKLKDTFESDVQANCAKYFNRFKNVPVMALETMFEMKYDSNVFKEKKWLHEREIELRRQLREQKIKFADIHHQQMAEEFKNLQNTVSKYEKQLSQDIAHARIFGKCFVSEEQEIAKGADSSCEAIEKKLYPWMSREYPQIFAMDKVLPPGEFPNFDSARYSKYESVSEPCFLRNLKLKSNGKGIVIPVSFGLNVPREVMDVIGLIRVLRVLKNELPIEITYFSNYINEYYRGLIIHEATTLDVKIQEARLQYLKITGKPLPNSQSFDVKDYPPQKLWFIDLTMTLNYKDHMLLMHNENVQTPNFLHGLSTLFNTFEEAIIISPHAIPLVEDLSAHLFQLDSYKQSGHLFFKLPSKLSYRLSRFPSGYHEVNSFIMKHLMPSEMDEKNFKLARRQSNAPTTKRVFDDYYQRLLDPSLVVINKSKVMSGILIAQNLLLHDEIRTRFDFINIEIAPEMLWLGQEIAGTSDHINFNFNYGVSVGMLTPEFNKKLSEMQLSQELCSSSWGQISDKDDILLLFVTSYQIENWRDVGYKFQSALEEKFIVMELKVVENMLDKSADKITIKTPNKKLFEILQHQPLYIDTIMRPPMIHQGVYVNGAREPNFAWKESEHDIGTGYKYWCTYDVIGSHNSGVRGVVVSLNEKKVIEYKSLLDMWYHHEHEKSNEANELKSVETSLAVLHQTI
jgi:hypothetical protein